MVLQEKKLRKKYLTIKEAQAVIPRIQPILLELMQMDRTLDLLASVDFSHDDDFEFSCFHIETSKNFHDLSLQFYKKLLELLKMGCMVKDASLGLVDFFSIHQGREILLCYQITENQIEYWHELDVGYHGRKHISLLTK